jgi:ferritin-like metal-binding protein YciE
MKQSSTVAGRGQKKTSASNGGSHGNDRMRANSDSSGRNNMGTTNSRQAGSSSRSSGRFEGQSHLEKFFLDQLQDIYYAEQKIVQSLPRMQQAATTGELKEAFEDHLHQTQRHVKRLEKVFETLGKKAEGKKCEAIEGIAREVEAIIGETEEGTLTRDAALIIAAQKVEHYEIATYGGLLQLAITMELHDVADLLDKTLVEEEDTDARLTEIAENEINLGAEHEGNQYSWNAQEEEAGGEEEDVDEESPSV